MKHFITIILLFTILIGRTQSLAEQLELIDNEGSIELLSNFFEEWAAYSKTLEVPFENDTITAIHQIYEKLIEDPENSKILNFSTVSNPSYFIPQNKIRYRIKPGNWDFNKIKVQLLDSKKGNTFKETTIQKAIRKKLEYYTQYSFREFRSSSDYDNMVAFYPRSNALKNMKVCHIANEYLAFEKFIGYQNEPLKWRNIPNPSALHEKRIALVRQVVLIQNDLTLGYDGSGIDLVTLNRSLDKAIVFDYSYCGMGYKPIIMQKNDLGDWEIVEWSAVLNSIRDN